MRTLLLGLIAFLAVLLVRLPARWLLPMLPPYVHCSVASGTVWNGTCNGLTVSNVQNGRNSTPLVLQTVRWTLHPLALLRARLAADVTAQGDWGQLSAAATLGTGSLMVNAMAASGTIDRRLLAVLPSGWSGSFDARNVVFELRQQRLLSLGGLATVRGLRDAQGKQYGDYQLQLAPVADAAAAGDLLSLAGPMTVAARVRVAQNLAWTVDGTVNGNALSVSGNF